MHDLKLQEIIWETTLRCNKNCEYCGSKEVINSKETTYIEEIDKINMIADAILRYPPVDLNLSGGEPSLLGKDLIPLVEKLSKKMNVKILTNGNLFKVFTKEQIDSMRFKAIGWSVNTEKDIEEVIAYLGYSTFEDKNVTMITNFGTHNIWILEKLMNLAKRKFPCWQIQLTMGKHMLPEEGIKHLRSKLDKADRRFVYADNLQYNHDCKAGIMSLGILSDGSVVPCLSERSWKKDMDIRGNLLNMDLQQIWEEDFKDRRFGDECKCCRNCIKYPETPKDSITIPSSDIDENIVLVYGVQLDPYYPKDDKSDPNKVYLYGVTSPYPGTKEYPPFGPNVDVYGVFPPSQVVAYAVIAPYSSSTISGVKFVFENGEVFKKIDD